MIKKQNQLINELLSNIEELLEKILLEAEVLDLKANRDCPAKGIIVESEFDETMNPEDPLEYYIEHEYMGQSPGGARRGRMKFSEVIRVFRFIVNCNRVIRERWHCNL